MAVEYRKDRGKWGFRVYRAGKRYKKFAWDSKTEAREAERQFLVERKSRPPVPENTLEAVAAAYLVASARKGRSLWRLDSLRWNLKRHILPHFGEATRISAIRPRDIEEFVLAQKGRRLKDGRPVSNKTIWNLVTDLRALFNWAQKEGLVRENPVRRADLDPIRNRKPHKPPLRPDQVELAASVLAGRERVFFDFLRFTGLRKDEANRVRWEDIDFERGWLHVRGTKTAESDNFIPLAPALLGELEWLAENDRTSDYVFPGGSAQTQGRKIYSRRRLFEKISRLTSRCLDCGKQGSGKRRRCLECGRVEVVSRTHRCSRCKSPNVEEGMGCLACGSANIRPGVKLRPKDLRDYFASEVAARVSDPNVVMRLLRHTNLTTTTRYLRTVKDRMQEAVRGLGSPIARIPEVRATQEPSIVRMNRVRSIEPLGATLGGNFGGEFLHKTTQNDIWPEEPQVGLNT